MSQLNEDPPTPQRNEGAEQASYVKVTNAIEILGPPEVRAGFFASLAIVDLGIFAIALSDPSSSNLGKAVTLVAGAITGGLALANSLDAIKVANGEPETAEDLDTPAQSSNEDSDIDLLVRQFPSEHSL